MSSSGSVKLRYEMCLQVWGNANAIEVGVEKELINVLEVVKTAVLNGELDAAIDNAANKLRDGFSK